MLKHHDSPSLTEYRLNSGSERVRHIQWRKLSKKRRRTLAQRSLKNLERKARKKSLSFGLDDYRHVESLVYSQLPYNPNGHHCSCNCIDEVEDVPDLEICGVNYGTSLASPGFELTENEGYRLVTPKTPGNEDSQSTLSGSASNRLVSRNSIQTARNSLQTARNTPQTAQSRGGARSDLAVSPRQICSKCKYTKCPGNHFNQNSKDNRRLSLAKEDGSLRSKIFGLRQKIRYYSEHLDRKESLSVQNAVKRKYTVAEKQLRQALKLSDELRLLKVKEMIHRSENAQLRKRIDGDGGVLEDFVLKDFAMKDITDEAELKEREESRIKTDLACRTWLQNVQSDGSLETNVGREEGKNRTSGYKSPRRNSNKSGTRMSVAYQLPALLEEEEEYKDGASEGFIEEPPVNSERKAKSYDILWINTVSDDNDDDGGEILEDEDDFSKTWPAFQSDPAQRDLNFLLSGTRDGARSCVTVMNKEMEDFDPIKKLVHRLESGLSFGRSSPETDVLDKSLVGTKSRIDDMKLAAGRLPEDQYYKTLRERQKSFGEAIKKKIREEIRSRGSLNSGKRNSQVSDNEIGERKMKGDATRRQSLVIDENNIKAFVNEAEEKERVVKEKLRKRDAVKLKDTDANDKAALHTNRRDSLLSSSSDSMQDPARQGGEEYDADNEGSVSVKYTENVAGKAHVVPNKKLYDLSTLRTVAQKHQTLRTLARLDEDMYSVSDGVDKLNAYRKCQATANIVKSMVDETARTEDDALPLTRREKAFSIPEPKNSRSLVVSDMAENERAITQINFKYDMIRDLRFLLMNQSTSRAFSYTYFKPAPPYLKTKWEKRIKRGFLRGVKEQKINEKQLETVEGVTHNVINRDVIHSETLKNVINNRQKSDCTARTDSRNSATARTESRNSANARSSTARSSSSKKGQSFKLPPLQLPGSPTPDELSFSRQNSLRSQSAGPENLNEAFAKLSKRHKFQEKVGLMRSVIRLSSYQRNQQADENPATDRSWNIQSGNENEAEERYKPRLKSNRRGSTFVQNVATSDPQSGRISVNSYDAKRRLSFMQAIDETR